jgi:hypothetical protein
MKMRFLVVTTTILALEGAYDRHETRQAASADRGTGGLHRPK